MDYKEVERKYQELVALRREGRLTQPEWEQQLKALLLQDLKGRYWTIGAQTGKWYYYDGSRWVEGSPDGSAFADGGVAGAPDAPPTRACPHCGFENQGMHALCSRCGKDMRQKEMHGATTVTPRDLNPCPSCGARVEAYLAQCPKCGKSLDGRGIPPPKARVEELVLHRETAPHFIEASTGSGRRGDEREIRAVNLLSCFKFLGGAGLIAGLVLGVFIGVIPEMGRSLSDLLPATLAQLRGRWWGGLAFGLGGAAGAGLAVGLYGILIGLLYNLLSIIFGGIRVRVSRIP